MVTSVIFGGKNMLILMCLVMSFIYLTQGYPGDSEKVFIRQGRLLPGYPKPSNGQYGIKPMTVAREEFLKQLIGYLSLVGRRK